MADYLDNVTLSDTYVAATTLGPADQYDHASVVVTAASARMQVARKMAGGNPGWEDREYLIVAGANTTQSFIVRGITGIRLKNATPGSVARAIVHLTGKDDLQFEGAALSQGTFGSSGASSLTIGSRLAYAEFTALVGIAATTEATSNAIVTAGAVVMDGATRIRVEFYIPRAQVFGANRTTFVLFEDGVAIGQIGSNLQNSGLDELPISGIRYLTPLSGSHIYSIRAFQSAAGTANMNAGAGGAGVLVPGYIRIQLAD